MKAVSYLAIFSGFFVLLISVSAPYLLEWQLSNTLAKYGSSDLAPQLVSEQIESIKIGLITSATIGALSILSGVFILRRKVIGLKLLVITCVLFIALALKNLITTQHIESAVTATIRGGWWLFLLMFALVKVRKLGKSWWSS